MELALETRGLSKRFGDLVAVDAVDLAVPRGSRYGFLGPNGAGKSTTIKCLTGLLRPSAGEIRILGLDPAREAVEVKRQVGVVPEDLGLFDRLSGRENLEFVGRVYGLSQATRRTRSSELLSILALEESGDTLVADYSHGMKKKLALAMALLPAPRLLFLDEPFEGIDALVSRQIRSILQAFVEGGGTLFLTSHILEIVERLCDRIGIISRGRLVAQGSLQDLRAARTDGGSVEEIFLGALAGPGDPGAPALLDWLAR